MAGHDPGAGTGGRHRRCRPGLEDPESRCGGTVLGHRPGCAVRVPAGPGWGGAGRGERSGGRQVLGSNVCRPLVGVGVPRRSRLRRPWWEPRTGGVLHRAEHPRGRRGSRHPIRRTGRGDPADRRGPRRGGAGSAGERSGRGRAGRCGAGGGVVAELLCPSTGRTGSRATRCGSRRCRCCWCGRPGTGRSLRSAAHPPGWTPWSWAWCRRPFRFPRRAGTGEHRPVFSPVVAGGRGHRRGHGAAHRGRGRRGGGRPGRG